MSARLVHYSCIYFLRFPVRVNVPSSDGGVALVFGVGVVGFETSVDEFGDPSLKLNLKHEERDGVVGPVNPALLSIDREMKCTCSPGLPAETVEVESTALPRKLMLSTDTRKSIAHPEVSVSTSSKNPSMETYVLFDGIGFLVLYLFELKCA
jgi:hypothetical protein